MGDAAAIFKAYDVRGLVPEQFDADLARSIGGAFGRLVRTEEPATTSVAVARDMRPSGEELSAAFTAGVTAQGLDVVDIGLASTDMLYFASGHLGIPGAVFTASHNPAGYNGIKMCLSFARPIGIDTGLSAMRDDVLGGGGAADDVDRTGTVTTADLLDGFADHVRSFIDVSALRRLRVVADTANGMGGLVVPAVFAALPVDLEVLFPELDGTFPNHPADPIQPENLVDLQDRILATGADVGLAFDGDADRVFLVDERARPVSGTLTTALVARSVLRREPGATIVHNLICGKVVPEVIAEHGGRAVRTRVGHSFIKAVMADEGAAFGGEHSGHYYFRDNWWADSGLIAALIVLEELSKSGGTLSELLEPFDRHAASGEINTVVDDPAGVIEQVAQHYAGLPQDRLDGLTVEPGGWWFNLRPSNTEPLLRLNLEASDAESCAARVAEVRALIDAAD